MKTFWAIVLVFAAVLAGAGEFRDIEIRVVPVPQKIEVVSEDTIPLKEGIVFRIASPLKKEEVEALVLRDAKQYWHITPTVVCSTGGETVADEGYQLDTTTPEIAISASSVAGVRNVLRTMRQLAEPERGVASSIYFVMPKVRIDDFPALKFRAFHFCGGMVPAKKIERAIRLAAYCKYNYFVLWHPIELAKHPDFVRKGALTRDEVRHLVAVGKELGVTLIPSITIYGHANGFESGGNCLLDAHPELAPLLEPSGNVWCVSNPAAVKFVEDVVGEYFDAFEKPPYFLVGCDEAFNAGSCSLCRKGGEYWKKVAAYLTYFRDYLAARHCRMMMWHDMFLYQDDPAWKGSTANGSPDAEKLRAALPRDIIFCYWEYDFANADFRAGKEGMMGFPIFDQLRKEGFDVVNSGWKSNTIAALGEKAWKNGGFGIMQTTWHEFSGSFRYQTMLAQGSTSGWNPAARYPKYLKNGLNTIDIINCLVRQVSQDMGIMTFPENGTK